MAQDRINNPEKWKERNKRAYQQSLAREGDNRVLKEILRMHKMTHEQYEKMLSEQNGLCKICNKPEERMNRKKDKVMRLVVDHCHETNKIRGLLCHTCNLMLGYSRDNKDILEMAIIYLEESQ